MTPRLRRRLQSLSLAFSRGALGRPGLSAACFVLMFVGLTAFERLHGPTHLETPDGTHGAPGAPDDAGDPAPR